jgi:hypothetical protein
LIDFNLNSVFLAQYANAFAYEFWFRLIHSCVITF